MITRESISALEGYQVADLELSIWRKSDGLAFVITTLAGEVLYRGLCLSAQGGSVEELRLDPLLEEGFGRVRLLVSLQVGVLVPKDLYRSEDGYLWLRSVCDGVGDTTSHMEQHEYTYSLPSGDRLLLYRPAEVLNAPWVEDPGCVVEYVPYFAPLIERRASRSRIEAGAELWLCPGRGGVDALSLRLGEVEYYNHYALEAMHSPIDAGQLLYQVFALWKALGLDVGRDRLILILLGGAEDSTPQVEVLEQVRELAAEHIAHVEVLPYDPLDTSDRMNR